MLAYYVEWHMRGAWRELMFADTEQHAKTKATRRTLDDGTPAHSFCTLLAELAIIVRNTCRTPQAAENAPTFEASRSLNLLIQASYRS